MPLEYCEISIQELFAQIFCEKASDLETPLHPQQLLDLEASLQDFRRDIPVSYVRRICEAVNGWLTTSQSRYVVKHTRGGYIPSLCIYEGNDAARQAYSLGLTFTDGDDPLAKCISAAAWAWVVSIIEVDVCSADVAPGSATEHITTDRMRRMLQRQEAHVKKIMQHQHRRHVVTLLFCGCEVWFVFWDHVGTLLSEPLDYLERPDILFKFLLAFANAGPICQGYDETVTLASSEQVHLLERYVPSQRYPDSVRNELLLAKEAILGQSEADRVISPIFSVHVKCEDTTYRVSTIPRKLRTFRYLFAGIDSVPPAFSEYAPRGFVAFDVDHNELVYMWDNWIPDSLVIKDELEVNEILFKAGVRHVPTVIPGGFVGTQVTVTQTSYLQNAAKWRRRRHHRLVVAQVWRPLWSFRDSRELVSAINDALIAHQDAYELAGLLHRNVNTDHILIDTFTGRGFLDGWCLSICRDDLAGTDRVGTWTYLSGLLLTYPRKSNALSDDLESFVYSLVLPVLRFITHNHSLVLRRFDGTTRTYLEVEECNDMLNDFIENTFRFRIRNGDHICGGEGKIAQIMRWKDVAVKTYNKSGPLTKILNDLFALLHEFYISLDEKAMDAQWGAIGLGARPRVSWKEGFEAPAARSSCLDEHTRIRAVFSTVLEDPSWDWTDTRTLDQFWGISPSISSNYPSLVKTSSLEYDYAERYLTRAKRGVDDGSGAEPAHKKARLGA